MFRLSQLAKHLSRPLPNYLHTSAAAASSRVMTSSPSATPDERNSRTIHTAACLIIGDEVLGGKVWIAFCRELYYDHSYGCAIGPREQKVNMKKNR